MGPIILPVTYTIPRVSIEVPHPNCRASDSQGGHHVAVKSTKQAWVAGKPLMIESNSTGGRASVVSQGLCDEIFAATKVRNGSS